MNKQEILENLRQTQVELSDYVKGLSSEDFESSLGDSWSAKGYLQHLILSNKPFAKGLNLPKDKLTAMFGEASQASRNYETLVGAYKARLNEGIKAENYDSVNPVTYRYPEGTSNEQVYLVDSWNETHERIYQALESWEEADLDRYQLPHPALGLLTIREMLYFTVAHNRLHSNDIMALKV